LAGRRHQLWLGLHLGRYRVAIDREIMNNESEQLLFGYPRHQVLRSIAGVIVVIALVVGYKVYLAEPSTADSAKVVCAMKVAADSPLIDSSKVNTRDDLAKSLRDRATDLQKAADKTGGDIKNALQKYASVMKNIADSVSADTDGTSLAEMVMKLSTNKELDSAEKTVKKFLDTQC